MTSIITGAAETLHSAAAAALAKAQVKPGDTVPVVEVKEAGNAAETFPFKLTGRNVIVGVPGAFTGTCSGQIPQYIQNYSKFQEKGIKDIYVVAVNDAFTLKAWKDNLASDGTQVKFIADDKGSLTSQLGLLFDATPFLGGPRSKRYVLVTEDDKITFVAVENVPSELTITAADKVLVQL